MNIARILYPVKVLGPGERIGIWVCGCPRRCSGCSNPELWEERTEYEITLQGLQEIIRGIVATHKVDGFTISGGEPMAQAQELVELVKYLKTVSTDILIYTGYKYEELCNKGDNYTDDILNSITVLIDGQYIEELNSNVVLRGSENQNIIVLDSEYKVYYKTYLETTHNQIQNFTTADGMVSVGMHKRDFAKLIENELSRGES